jgi:hypothetical protein
VPIRDRIAEDIAHDVVGRQVWNGLTGECSTMPTEAWERVKSAADLLFERIVSRVDWSRVLIEAQGRHLGLDHSGELCGPCLRDALLSKDRWADPTAAPPPPDG